VRDDEIITFDYEGLGRVEFTVAQCRELCPEETAALGEAYDQLALASEGGPREQAVFEVQVERRCEALRRAMIIQGERWEAQLLDDDKPANDA
jgi:hypothetical protein